MLRRKLLYSAKQNPIDKYVDVQHITAPGSSNIQVTVNKDEFDAVGVSVSGEYEKLNIPLTNLIIGKWYKITFSENLINPYLGSSGCYGCAVLESPVTNISYSGIIPYQVTKSATDNNTYCWCISYNTSTTDYMPSSHNILCFKAISNIMYWVWDYSKIGDGKSINSTVIFEKLEIINTPSIAYIDFLNASLYGFNYSSGQKNGQGTFKMGADYSLCCFETMAKGGSYEKIVIPIKNLIINHRYKIKFSHLRTGTSLSSSDYDYCYSVKNAACTDTKAKKYHEEEGWVQNTENEFIDEEYIFTAEEETMWWNWSVAKLKDDATNRIVIYNVAIIEI